MDEHEIPALIEREYAAAIAEARVPPAEVVWLQARMRAREEAARKAVRPILIGQAVAIAALLGALASILSRFSFTVVPQIPLSLLGMVLASWLVLGLAPLALYLGFSRD